jgi:hypothetical protein
MMIVVAVTIPIVTAADSEHQHGSHVQEHRFRTAW